jgi:gamma-glutamyltranspeptidase / glutathione hydrolase
MTTFKRAFNSAFRTTFKTALIRAFITALARMAACASRGALPAFPAEWRFRPGADAVVAPTAMVVSNSEIASRVGAEIMRRGGNAVDAAVAVGFALTVTYPGAGNIGGGGFMVIRLANGETAALDYREVAPLGAIRAMYVDSR